MSLFTGPGRNSEMSVMMSPNESIPDLPTSSRWPGDSIWKQPRVCERADQREGLLVVERHLRLVVEVDLDAVDPLDLGDRVRHRRLHPDAEHVELEQAEVLDVVLVELAHREPGEAGLDRGPVEQRGVGEQHPAGVHRDVPGQPVEPLGEPEEQAEPLARRARRRAARAAPAAPSGRPGPGCAGTPWRSRRSRRAACRAPRRRRGSRAGPGRCPSSRPHTQRSPP